MSGDETWAALETAAVRVAPDITSQTAANLVWAYSTLSTLRDVNRPPCYATLWDSLESRDFNSEGLCMLFHASRCSLGEAVRESGDGALV
jgi:hypothetical protein